MVARSRFLCPVLVCVLYSCVFCSTGFSQDLSTATPSTSLPEKPGSCPDGCIPAPPADPSLWSKSLGLGASVTDGNSNTSLVNVQAAISRDYENNIWEFDSNYSYGESDTQDSNERELTRNQLNVAAGYKRLFSERFFAGLGGKFKYDEIANIDYRFLINPTLGSYLLRENNVKFSLEAGPSYVIERVGNVEDNYLAPRIADTFEWKFNGNGRLFQTLEVLFDVTNSDNYIFNAEAGVESALTSLLSLVFVVRDAYDNVPAMDREKNDIAFITSLKVNL